jgi:GMP synthase (glutamine-hydrolysing) B subunit
LRLIGRRGFRGAIGSRLSCILVDNGLLRKDEKASVLAEFSKHFQTDLHVVEAEDRFLSALRGVTEPQEKRRRIGHAFIECFKAEALRVRDARFLAQGTLYPDVIESGAAPDGPAATIKLHHNVGGLPEELGFELIEPLRNLFKDEVRKLGVELGLPEDLVWRHPFPGPGLAVRCLGEVTKERLDVLREADAIVVSEIKCYFPGIRRAVAGAERGRHGRRADVRERSCLAVRRNGRLHDRRLEPAAVRPAGADCDADHQRGKGGEPSLL